MVLSEEEAREVEEALEQAWAVLEWVASGPGAYQQAAKDAAGSGEMVRDRLSQALYGRVARTLLEDEQRALRDAAGPLDELLSEEGEVGPCCANLSETRAAIRRVLGPEPHMRDAVTTASALKAEMRGHQLTGPRVRKMWKVLTRITGITVDLVGAHWEDGGSSQLMRVLAASELGALEQLEVFELVRPGDPDLPRMVRKTIFHVLERAIASGVLTAKDKARVLTGGWSVL